MITKCANPACNRVFRYLHEGHLFAIERYETTNGDDRDISEWGSRSRVVEFYWLCKDCFDRGALSILSGKLRKRVFPQPLIQYRVEEDDVPEITFEEEAA